MARYTYDSWGKVISVTNSAGNAITDTNNIAHKNPYRYRGYRYDTETGLYYLQSRYYNPEWSRFVNADGLVSTGQGMFSHNMYVYCENNPVNNVDVTGHLPITIGTLLGIAITAIAVAIIPTETWENIGQTIGNIATAVVDAGKTVVSNIKKKVTSTKIKTTATTTTKTEIKKQEIFPLNPHDFKPRGLKKTEYSGSKNGKIIKWTQNNITIFEWNEDIKNGSHYHTFKIEWDGKHSGPHYAPLSPVPEPWNSLYFGGKS